MSSDIFEAIIREIDSLEKYLTVVIVETHSKRLKYVANMITTVKGLCKEGHKEWSVFERELKLEYQNPYPEGEGKLFHELARLKTTEDRLLKIAREISQVIYTDREFHDRLKGKYLFLYQGIKEFVMRIVNLMIHLKNEQEGVVVRTEALEREFVKEFDRDPSAMIGHYFNHIH